MTDVALAGRIARLRWSWTWGSRWDRVAPEGSPGGTASGRAPGTGQGGVPGWRGEDFACTLSTRGSEARVSAPL